MRLVLKVTKYRTIDGRDLRRGDVWDVQDDVARHMISTGKAEEVTEAEKPAGKARSTYRRRDMRAEE